MIMDFKRCLISVSMMACTASCAPSTPPAAPASPTRAIEAFQSPDLPKTPGYSHAVSARGALVVTSGEIALDKQGNVVGPGDMQAQTEQVFANVQAALAAARTDFKHVIKLTVFVTDARPENLVIFRQVRDRYVDTAKPPANSLVQVAKLVRPELVIEMEAVAVAPD